MADIVGEEYPAVEGISTALQAQILRLYAPTRYENRIVLISDIDMLPLSKEYFISNLPKEEDEFVIYSSDVYANGRYPMCYIASKGDNYNIFKEDKNETWDSFVTRLNSLDYGWDTDELYMSEILNTNEVNLKKLNRGWSRGTLSKRFDRSAWDPNLSEYIDAHCPRPYSKFKNVIDPLRNLISDD